VVYKQFLKTPGTAFRTHNYAIESGGLVIYIVFYLFSEKKERKKRISPARHGTGLSRNRAQAGPGQA
jgi:hypothetical protein